MEEIGARRANRRTRKRKKGRWEKVIAAHQHGAHGAGLGYVVLGGYDAWNLHGACGCNGPCCSGLGAITPDQAAEMAFPKAKVRSTPGFTQIVRDNIVAAAQSGQFVSWNQSICMEQPSSVASRTLSLVSSGSGLALQGAIQGGLLTAGPATLGISIAIAGITALFGTIFSHHAAAIAQERRVLCASVPAANNYLSIIDQALQAGRATPQQAISALQSLQSDFTSNVQSILKMSSDKCNAACVWIEQLKAIVAMKTAAYQDLANQSTAPISSGSGPTSAVVTSGSTLTIPASNAAQAAAAASSPSWLPIAALLVGGFFLMRVA